jgi:hypothetical protein
MTKPKKTISARARAEVLNKIRVGLFDLGIEQAELAKRAGITPQYLNAMLKLAQKIKYGKAGTDPKIPISDKKIDFLQHTFQNLVKEERNVGHIERVAIENKTQTEDDICRAAIPEESHSENAKAQIP